MPVVRNVEKSKLSPELMALMPESEKELVVVGDTVYEIVPLAAGQVEHAAQEILNIIRELFGEITGAATRKDEVLNYAMMADALQRGIGKAIDSGAVVRLLATALDLDEKEVRARITVKQIYHVAGVLWKQNFDMSSLAEGSRKNFESLLGAFGLKTKTPDIVYQWAEYTLRVLSSPQAGSHEERIKEVIRVAESLGLGGRESTTEDASATSQGTMASPVSTSTASE